MPKDGVTAATNFYLEESRLIFHHTESERIHLGTRLDRIRVRVSDIIAGLSYRQRNRQIWLTFAYTQFTFYDPSHAQLPSCYVSLQQRDVERK